MSIQLLEAVRDRWREDGAPTAGALRPGLDDSEMDDLTAQLGLRLPPEARTLWSWHDGAEPGRGVLWIGTGWEPLSLARAVSLTEEYRMLFRGLEDVHGLAIWPETFLVLTRPDQPDVLTIDGDRDLPASLVSHFVSEDAAASVFAHSIGELVERWLGAMEKRLTHFDRSRSKWAVDWDAIDEAGQI